MEPVIELKQVRNELGGQLIHDQLDLTIYPGEIIALAGSSGCGKTTLLRAILMLIQPVAGEIRIFSTNVMDCSATEALAVKHRCGMAFQQGALFSSLTVLENVMLPLREFTRLTPYAQRELAMLKIILTGLSADAAVKYPAELSGGMQKRVAVARALALDPELLFLDEPTAGLDPQSADGFDELILQLHAALNLTVVMVTHDLDSLWRVAHKVAFLGEKKVLALDTMENLMASSHPLIHAYFSGPRAQLRDRQDG